MKKISYDGREFFSIFFALRDERFSLNALLCLHMFIDALFIIFSLLNILFLVQQKNRISLFSCFIEKNAKYDGPQECVILLF